MKFVIQRVTEACCKVDQDITGAIDAGYCVLIGIEDTDTREIVDKMLSKMLNLRIFSDENGKTNLSLKDVNGSLLLISQFTLYADCRKGNRPSFSYAGKPAIAEPLYLYFNEYLRKIGIHVEEGIFGADMKVDLLNDGPVTIILDSDIDIRK